MYGFSFFFLLPDRGKLSRNSVMRSKLDNFQKLNARIINLNAEAEWRRTKTKTAAITITQVRTGEEKDGKDEENENGKGGEYILQ